MRAEFLILKNKKRIGVFGGTFDPIHNGHILIAEKASENFNLDIIIFVPTGSPNFKLNKSVGSKRQRYSMTQMATVNHENFYVSALEVDRAGVSYTIDTINTIDFFKDSDAEIFFIMGYDSVLVLEKWFRAKELLKSCNFIVLTRPNYDKLAVDEKINFFKEKYGSIFFNLDIEGLDISSTKIRASLEKGEYDAVKDSLNKDVFKHIKKLSLYSAINREEILKLHIQKFISEKRYQHSLNVLDLALKLGERYNCSTAKIYIATLLHDIAKEFDEIQIRDASRKYNLDLQKMYDNFPQLVHGVIGAEITKDYFGIDDLEILNAIKYHTTGRENMSLLEKIVFIADKVEFGRKNYEGLNKIRELAFTDLDGAIILSLQSSINYNKMKDIKIHELSIKSLEYLKKCD